MKRTDDVVSDPELQCKVDECERRRWAHGYCPTHYRRWTRHGDAETTLRQPGPRTCSADGCDKPAPARGMCSTHYQRQYRKENPPAKGSHRERTRKYILKQYGMTIEDYGVLVEKQGGRCAICTSSSPGRKGTANYSWCVDHDHVTGQIRGLLCRHCNTAIGLLGDDPDVVLRAARYIQQHRQMPLPL